MYDGDKFTSKGHSNNFPPNNKNDFSQFQSSRQYINLNAFIQPESTNRFEQEDIVMNEAQYPSNYNKQDFQIPNPRVFNQFPNFRQKQWGPQEDHGQILDQKTNKQVPTPQTFLSPHGQIQMSLIIGQKFSSDNQEFAAKSATANSYGQIQNPSRRNSNSGQSNSSPENQAHTMQWGKYNTHTKNV